MTRGWRPAGAGLIAVGLWATAAAAQTTEFGALMRQKQEHARGILDAVVVNDWLALEQRSSALVALADSPAWAVLRTPRYQPYSEAFLRAAHDLVTAAKERNPATAPLAYVALTLSCVQCHHHVGRTPVAGGAGGTGAPRTD